MWHDNRIPQQPIIDQDNSYGISSVNSFGAGGVRLAFTVPDFNLDHLGVEASF